MAFIRLQFSAHGGHLEKESSSLESDYLPISACELKLRGTLVKFSDISPTRAGSYCQRTTYKMASSVSIFHRESAAKFEPAVLGENLLNMTSVWGLLEIQLYAHFAQPTRIYFLFNI